jgi:F0F1-type ATP synthase membrane subunit b/b'
MLDSIVGLLKVVDLTPLDGVMALVGTVLIFLLHRVLANSVFSPLLEHVEQRESLTSGALLAASQMRQKTEALKARFDEAMFKARVEGNQKAAEIVSAAKDQAAKIIRDAENDAAREIQAGREAIAKQISQANQAAEKEAQDLAGRLAAQVDTQLAAN